MEKSRLKWKWKSSDLRSPRGFSLLVLCHHICKANQSGTDDYSYPEVMSGLMKRQKRVKLILKSWTPDELGRFLFTHQDTWETLDGRQGRSFTSGILQIRCEANSVDAEQRCAVFFFFFFNIFCLTKIEQNAKRRVCHRLVSLDRKGNIKRPLTLVSLQARLDLPSQCVNQETERRGLTPSLHCDTCIVGNQMENWKWT